MRGQASRVDQSLRPRSSLRPSDRCVAIAWWRKLPLPVAVGLVVLACTQAGGHDPDDIRVRGSAPSMSITEGTVVDSTAAPTAAIGTARPAAPGSEPMSPSPGLIRPATDVPAAPAIGAPLRYATLAPPAGSPIGNIRRDCPLSAPLTGGRTLWVFCDTTLFEPTGVHRFFVNTTAALADDAHPLVLLEPLDRRGAPLRFLAARAGTTCSGQSAQLLWPTALTSWPAADGRVRVLVHFWSACALPGTAADTVDRDIGLAEYWFDPAAPPGTRLSGTLLNEHLFPPVAGRPGFGLAAARKGDDLFVYRCEGAPTDPGGTPGTQPSSACFVGRVGPAEAHAPEAYRFFDGTTWSAGADRAVPLPLPGSFGVKVSVKWIEPLQRFVMVHDVPESPAVAIRTARAAEGPWSAPAVVSPAGCVLPYPQSCFAYEVHEHLSDATTLGITFYDAAQPNDGVPSRVVYVPINLGTTP